MEWTSGQFFTIAASAYLGATAAGAMKACKNIIGVLHILFFGLANVIPIRASKILHASGIKPMVNYLRKVAFWGGALTAIFGIIAASAPDFWLHLIYGAEYNSYGFVLRWYALIYFVSFFSIVLRAGLRTMEHTKPIFLARMFATIFTLVFAIPMINAFGLSGAMIGMLCADAISRLIQILAFTRRVKKEME